MQNDVLNDGLSDVSIVDSMGDDYSVIRAARVSYAKDGQEWKDSDAKLIKFMADHGHGTPFEHTGVTFHVACPLFVRGQWHRHRIGWSYNEVSRRYTSDEIEFHVPDEWRLQNTSGNKQGSAGTVTPAEHDVIFDKYNRLLTEAHGLYLYLSMVKNVGNEQARMVLPQSMYTRFYATCNLRSAAHFINLRSDEHAQPEIRAYSDEMREQLRVLFPVSIAALCDTPEPATAPVKWYKKLLRGFGG